jgi:hypothetical protein
MRRKIITTVKTRICFIISSVRLGKIESVLRFICLNHLKIFFSENLQFIFLFPLICRIKRRTTTTTTTKANKEKNEIS